MIELDYRVYFEAEKESNHGIGFQIEDRRYGDDETVYVEVINPQAEVGDDQFFRLNTSEVRELHAVLGTILGGDPGLEASRAVAAGATTLFGVDGGAS